MVSPYYIIVCTHWHIINHSFLLILYQFTDDRNVYVIEETEINDAHTVLEYDPIISEQVNITTNTDIMRQSGSKSFYTSFSNHVNDDNISRSDFTPKSDKNATESEDLLHN